MVLKRRHISILLIILAFIVINYQENNIDVPVEDVIEGLANEENKEVYVNK